MLTFIVFLQVNVSNIDIFSPKPIGAFDHRPMNRPSSNPAVDIISMEEDDGLFCGDVTLPVIELYFPQYINYITILDKF